MAKRTQYSVEETVDSTAHPLKKSDGEGAFTKARLKCAYPLELDVVVDLARGRVVLGRAPEEPSSVMVSHPTVSRAHFAIEWDAAQNRHLGRDLNSRNGASVDRRPARDGWAPLLPGSVVRLGDVLFVYESGHTLESADPGEVSRSAVPGQAMAIRRLRSQLARAAPDLSPVLIIGETGTGKEQIAQEVHRLSGRPGDFVPVNCATLGEQLIESQLFGHVKGAFTGATSDSPGLFRAAERGTIFLDEIGEMPKELQPKLLRAIQEREVRAVGSSKSERVDVRVVAATHQNLAARAHAGEFRQDLYARLALWELHVPPIRERRADVLSWLSLLHEHWLTERGQSAQGGLRFNVEAAETLLLGRWPENLRGLNRFVHEIASRKHAGPVRAEHLPGWIREGDPA